MKIDHLAIWCRDLEAMRSFYLDFFDGVSNDKYVNPVTGFASYFLTFPGSEARLELMQMPGIAPNRADVALQYFGLAHFALKVGSEVKVHEMTEHLRLAGCAIIRGPRRTGDGYFETEALDIEGNRLEIVA